MLWQLHHQFRDGHTEMRGQRDINTHDEMRTFVEEMQQGHPLPENVLWLVCKKGSEYFWMKGNKNEAKS